MPGINRQPTGILGFLGIKNLGRNPEQVINALAPTWDYSEWYLQTSARFQNVSVAFTSVGFFAAFQVPTNEVWRVHAFSCLAGPLGAAETIRIHPCIADQASATFVLLPENPDTISVTAGGFGCCAADRPVILGPGEVAGFFCSDLKTAAANIGATAAIRFTPMQA